MTDRIDAEALRRAHAATTPGEWAVQDYRGRSNNMLRVIARGILGIARINAGTKDKANARFIALAHREWPALLDRIEALEAENVRLREALAKANGATWFYLGDDCSSDNCRFSIDECIEEDFLHYNSAVGDHVVLISGARPVPDMWLALKFFTEEEKDEREDDEPYTFTIHESEEAALKATDNA